MEDIFDTLIEAIEENAFHLFFAKAEYRQKQFCVDQHMQWLEEHLSEEEKLHLEQAKAAWFDTETLERKALVRAAIAVGIRFALP